MYDDIRPYNDAETCAALKRASNNRLMEQISAFLFPGKDPDILRNTLNTIQGVDDFQTRVMFPAVGSILGKTTKGLSYEGVRYFTGGRCYTLLSSHRDIVLDSAFIQYIFKDHNLPLSEIAVGDNLIYNQFVEDLMRSNRMIKVARGTGARELYETSRQLSSYIRMRINDEHPASVWISHRNGRTKDGRDLTEQGLLKMLSMSGPSAFTENMKSLHIMPVAISYEIEPCGIRKAYEVYVKQMMGSYIKRPGEDLESIVSGILQQKGRVHVAFCKPITEEELRQCEVQGKNECFRSLARIVDDRILAAWKIWPSNIAAAELLEGRPSSDKQVTAEFEKYLNEELLALPLSGNRRPVRDTLISIYATPALRKGL
jgi:Glycerol-3-phosphate O-acyltransferase